MHILTFGSERKLFEKGGRTRDRIEAQARAVGSFSVIVFTTKKHNCAREEHVGEHLHLYATNSSSRLLYGLDAIRISRKIGRVDLISGQDAFESGLVAILIGKLRRIPVQIQVHTDLFNPHFISLGLLNRIRVILAHVVLRQADCIRAVSKRIVDDIRTHGIKKNVSVLPVYVDLMTKKNEHISFSHKESYPKYSKVILMVSRLHTEKCPEVGIKAFARIAKNYPESGLVIVGDGPMKSGLEQLVKKLKITDQVSFAGWKEDLVPYYTGSDIYLHSTKYEGYGLTLIEAAFFGLAIVSTEVGIMGSILEQDKHAVICPVGNEICMARQLSRLLDNVKLSKSLGEAAQERVLQTEVMTFEQYVDRLKQIFISCRNNDVD